MVEGRAVVRGRRVRRVVRRVGCMVCLFGLRVVASVLLKFLWGK